MNEDVTLPRLVDDLIDAAAAEDPCAELVVEIPVEHALELPPTADHVIAPGPDDTLRRVPGLAYHDCLIRWHARADWLVCVLSGDGRRYQGDLRTGDVHPVCPLPETPSVTSPGRTAVRTLPRRRTACQARPMRSRRWGRRHLQQFRGGH